MAREQKPISEMTILRAAKVYLVPQEVARKLAELLVKANYGQDELKRQAPFSVVDGGDKWVISGSRKFGEFPDRQGYIDYGPMHIEIAKKDCQILAFVRSGEIAKKKP